MPVGSESGKTENWVSFKIGKNSVWKVFVTHEKENIIKLYSKECNKFYCCNKKTKTACTVWR